MEAKEEPTDPFDPGNVAKDIEEMLKGHLPSMLPAHVMAHYAVSAVVSAIVCRSLLHKGLYEWQNAFLYTIDTLLKWPQTGAAFGELNATDIAQVLAVARIREDSGTVEGFAKLLRRPGAGSNAEFLKRAGRLVARCEDRYGLYQVREDEKKLSL